LWGESKERCKMSVSHKLILNNLIVSIFKEQNEILVDSLYKRPPWTQEEINKIIIKYEEEWDEAI
jgi:hypothetical protein